MATVSGALPVIDEAGRRRRATGRLAGISLVSGTVSPILLVVAIYLAMAFGLGWDSQVPEGVSPVPALLVLLSGLAAPVVALATGIMVFLRTRWGVQTPTRIAALAGIVLGGLCAAGVLKVIGQILLGS